MVILIIECVQQLNCTRMVVVEQQVIYTEVVLTSIDPEMRVLYRIDEAWEMFYTRPVYPVELTRAGDDRLHLLQ